MQESWNCKFIKNYSSLLWCGCPNIKFGDEVSQQACFIQLSYCHAMFILIPVQNKNNLAFVSMALMLSDLLEACRLLQQMVISFWTQLIWCCMNRWITKYANDQNLFFSDFKKAYTKLVNTGAKWRSAWGSAMVIQTCPWIAAPKLSSTAWCQSFPSNWTWVVKLWVICFSC